MKVLHDGELWRVCERTPERVDGEPGYTLSRSRGPGRPALVIWARESDCTPAPDKPQVRRLRADDVVLEFDARGAVSLRRAGSRKRYVTSLAALYSATVKAHVNNERALKRINKRKGRK